MNHQNTLSSSYSILKRTSVFLAASAIVFGGLFLFSNRAFAATLIVPDEHLTIQAAIDAALAGDTITVTAGTYDEQLVINKDVTITGAPGAIIQPTGNDDAWDIQFVAGGSGATLEGFTLDFAANNRPGRGIGVSDNAGPAVTNVTIQNNDITMGVGIGAATVGLEGVGIQTGLNADVSGLLITGNTFHGGSAVILDGASAGEEGIYINPNAGTGAITISNNTFDGELFTGISVESGNVTVSGNTVTRPSVVQNTNGIRVNDFVGGVTYSVVVSNNAVSGFQNGFRVGSDADAGSTLAVALSDNTISNNTRGMLVKNDAVVTASNNSITGNTSFGAEILSGSDGTLNAANNWWGASTGPTHASNPGGLGDAVSDSVLFDPWYTDAALSVLSGVASVASANPNTVDPLFTPEIVATLTRGSEAYLGRTTTYLGSPLGAVADSIKWRVTVDGPAALTADMIDLDEVGWTDQTDSSTLAFHYPLATVGDNLVATGSCDDTADISGHTDCTHDFGFSLDSNDIFTNADKIKFNSNAPAGSYAITYELVSTADGLVVGTHVVPVQIVNTTLTATLTAENKVYDGNDLATILTRTLVGVLPGDVVTANEDGAATFVDANANIGKVVTATGITLAGADAGNYTYDGTATGAADITPLGITVTPNVTVPKFYGEADPVFIYTSDPLLGADSFTGDLSREAGEDVGTYGLTLGTLSAGGNYTLTLVPGTFSINKAVPVVTWGNPADIVYGTALNGTQLNAASVVDGTFVYTPALGTVLNVGVGQSLEATFTPTDTANYFNVVAPASITVTPAPLTVTADDISEEYGLQGLIMTASYNGFVNGETSVNLDTPVALSTLGGTVSPVGDYEITASEAADANYNITFVSGMLTIIPSPVTVTANDQSKDYGDADPALSYGVTSGGLINGDVFSGALTRDVGESVGAYAITQGDLALSGNYALTFVPATLTINSGTFDTTIALTEAGQWALVSAPTLLSASPTITDNGSGAVALLVYRNGAFVVPSAGDDELVNPLGAFYIKTTNTGNVGLKFAAISSPTQASKQLALGWNLVGTNHEGLAQNEFSSIQNTPTNAGMVTLFVPDTFNSRKGSGYIPAGSDVANMDLNANPITALPVMNNLSPYDGYWVFMNAVKTFVKNL